MTDHLPDAPVSPERLDELIALIGLWNRCTKADYDMRAALRHYKALREEVRDLRIARSHSDQDAKEAQHTAIVQEQP